MSRTSHSDNERRACETINFLASMDMAHTTVTRSVAKLVLLKTDAQLMCRGQLREIVAKSLGAGVYRMTTKRWEGS